MKTILSILTLIVSLNCLSQTTIVQFRNGTGTPGSAYLTNALANGNVWVGNGSGIATGVTPGGDLSMTNAGVFTVTKINNISLAGLATGILKNTTGTGVPTIAVAGTDYLAPFTSQTQNTFYAAPSGSAGVPTFRVIVPADIPTLNQNTTGSAATAATLTTPRNIYGNSFNGSADLTQIIAATFGGTGNGFTAFNGPITSTKTFTLPNANATILTSNSPVTVVQGGTGTNTVTGILVGDGTNPVAAVSGTASQYLRRNAGNTAYEFAALPGGGDVLKVGAPVNNQLGVWTGNGTIEGDVNLVFSASTLQIGVAGSALGSLVLAGNTSGIATIRPPAIAGTPILTLPIVTGTIVAYVEGTTASSATPSPTGNARENVYDITALATNPTFAAPSGTPANHNVLKIRIKDNGTARTLAWNAIYRGGSSIALPTVTTISKTMYIQFEYNGADLKWDLVGQTDGLFLPFIFVIGYRRRKKLYHTHYYRQAA